MTPNRDAQDVGAFTEKVFSGPTAAASEMDSWWSRYSSTFDGFTETSRSILAADCEYIVDRGIFGAGDPSTNNWPTSRARRGLVMGSVQSGKTASMLGAIARSLDRGVDIVIVLAGTRLSLWQQTFDRIHEQLDAGEDSAEKRGRRILLPKSPPTDVIPLSARYQVSPARVERALRRKQPLIVVALKHAGHLQALGQSLNESVYSEVRKLERPVHILVLDDEADDGSILDARIEASQDPILGNLKQIPRAIVDLWSPPSQIPPANLFATYVGYTATPQANFLQEEDNPLAPRDFLITLRTPLDRGDLALRSSTYAEPQGIDRYYTGGEVFYRRGRAANLCVSTSSSPGDDLAEAIRSFLVAGAVRLYRSGQRIGPYTARRSDFESLQSAKEVLPNPHSMLIHPSALVGDHFATAEDVMIWAGAPSRAEARSLLNSGRGFLPGTVVEILNKEEEKWAAWLDRFQESSDQIHREFNTLAARQMPDWQTVKQLLIEEVIPGTRVAVVNSDPAADDRPEYAPETNDVGQWRAPRDMSTIFVSGNVMARGLTLEGLTTTLFLRDTNSPRADTQMQMQRWFGYRGAQIELCRVFASQSQIDFFANYHDVDEALRAVLAQAMRDGTKVPSPHVLQGRGFLATGKIANLGNKPLHPGRKPFIPLINSGKNEDPNAVLLANLFQMNPSTDVMVDGQVKGRILSTPLSLGQAADLLDDLSFVTYKPGTESQQSELWSQTESAVSAIQPLPTGYKLYRPPTALPGESVSPVRKDCPYGIPAYLRLWEECLTRHVRGLFVTGVRDQLWSRTNLAAKGREQPRFWVGIRYGSKSGPIADGPFGALPFDIRTTKRSVADGLIETTWGSNDPDAGPAGFRGDEYFDYYHRGEALPHEVPGEEPWRPAGSDGQILFYVNKQAGEEHPSVAIGVCIPTGGPDQFAAVIAQPRPAALV